MNVYEKIAAQQGEVGTAVWCVGEQLKDMIAGAPELEEILSQDLEQEAMSLKQAEQQIHDFADAQHKKSRGSCIAVSPKQAEDILRKFYGLPERDEPVAPVRQSPAPQVHTASPQMPQPPKQSDDLIDLDAFL